MHRDGTVHLTGKKDQDGSGFEGVERCEKGESEACRYESALLVSV